MCTTKQDGYEVGACDGGFPHDVVRAIVVVCDRRVHEARASHAHAESVTTSKDAAPVTIKRVNPEGCRPIQEVATESVAIGMRMGWRCYTNCILMTRG